MSNILNEEEWSTLLYSIKHGRCTPFLGAGAAYGALPLAGDIAREWSKQHHYPFSDTDNLPRVAQFIAVKSKNFIYPKELLADAFNSSPGPDFNQSDEPHAVLAELPLPVYITTNYDNFMVRALRENKREHKEPVQIACRWTEGLKKKLGPSEIDKGFSPTPEKPLVFHLHGQLDLPESMVLTEEDYVDFLVHITSHFQETIPSRIHEAFADSTILFLGYSLADWDFRTLFRAISKQVAMSAERPRVSVQLLPSPKDEGKELTEDQKMAIKEYLDKYYEHLKIGVVWCTCREFMGELRRRWEDYRDR